MQPLDDDLRDIVDAYTRSRTPSEAARDATWAAIARSLDVEAIAAEPAPRRTSSRRVVVLGVLGVLGALAAGVLLGVGLAPSRLDDADPGGPGTAAYSRIETEAPRAIEALAPEATKPRERNEHVADPSVASPPIGAPVAPTPEPASSSRPRADRHARESVEAPDALRREMSLIRTARTALTDGRPRRARELLEAHRRRFPRGMLREEARALEVAVLCETGPRGRWRSALASFDRDYPGSPLRAKLRDECAP